MTYAFTWSEYYLRKNVAHVAMYILHYIPLKAQSKTLPSIIRCIMKFARTAAKNVIF